MGGDYEDTVKSSKKAVKTDEGQVTSPPAPAKTQAQSVAVASGVPADQVLRYHKKGNEIHFHDDANKLKCVVPASEWFGIARNIASMRMSYYLDKGNKTFLRVEPFVTDGVADMSITVEPVTVGSTLKSIFDFNAQQGL